MVALFPEIHAKKGEFAPKIAPFQPRGLLFSDTTIQGWDDKRAPPENRTGPSRFAATWGEQRVFSLCFPEFYLVFHPKGRRVFGWGSPPP